MNRGTGALEPGPAVRAAAALDSVVADGRVVVGQLFPGRDAAGCANPDRLPRDLEPAVGAAGVIDEAGDVAPHRSVTAPCAIDPEHPDAALLEVSRLARRAVA